MSAARALAALTIGSLVAGCAVGPNYQAPTPPAGAAAPLVSVNPVLESPAAPPDDWWRLYDDAELDGLVRQALAANTDLAAAEANLSVARASLEGARNGLYPQTDANFGAIYGHDATTDEIFEIDGHKPRTVWLFDDVLDVSYELDLFGRVRRSIEASHADAQAAAAARDAVKITVAAETARAYAQVCALGEQIAVAQRALDVTGREARIIGDRRDAGSASDFDVVRAQELVAQARSAIPPLEGQRRAALFQLTALVGRTPSLAPAEALDCVTPPHLSALMPVGDGAALLRRRPDVRLAERRLAAATARIGVATADLYPRISLTGLYGGAAASLGDLVGERGLTWGVGPSINWAFPNMAGTFARIHAAKAGAQAALDEFDSTVLQALKETEQALAAYDAEVEHHADLVDAQRKAQAALDMAHGQFVAGSVSTLDLLASEEILVGADTAVASSDAALAQDQVGVFKALGGGWQGPSRQAAR
jgi:NodT family efflux transporter outer membrane factor (OMF) lipoprotein